MFFSDRAHPVADRAASGTCPVPATGRGVRAGAGALRLRTNPFRQRQGTDARESLPLHPPQALQVQLRWQPRAAGQVAGDLPRRFGPGPGASRRGSRLHPVSGRPSPAPIPAGLGGTQSRLHDKTKTQSRLHDKTNRYEENQPGGFKMKHHLTISDAPWPARRRHRSSPLQRQLGTAGSAWAAEPPPLGEKEIVYALPGGGSALVMVNGSHPDAGGRRLRGRAQDDGDWGSSTQALANGDLDVFSSAFLPGQQSHVNKYEDKLDFLGTSYAPVPSGLMAPAYVRVQHHRGPQGSQRSGTRSRGRSTAGVRAGA